MFGCYAAVVAAFPRHDRVRSPDLKHHPLLTAAIDEGTWQTPRPTCNR